MKLWGLFVSQGRAGSVASTVESEANHRAPEENVAAGSQAPAKKRRSLGCINGVMEKKMETTIVGYIRFM